MTDETSYNADVRARSQLADDLLRAEGLMAAGEDEQAVILLASMAEDAEHYVEANCPTTETLQWFSFPSIFERLCYRRVEDDPRELRDVGEPLDRLYADLAFALVRRGDYERAAEALKRAVRWNPMGCGYRLDLAELCKTNGDIREWIALSYSVFERASDVRHLARAYANFAEYFGQTGQPRLEAAALRCGRRLALGDPLLTQLCDLTAGSEADPDAISDDEAAELLAAEGIPDGANAEVAICLLMCATDAAAAGDRNTATNLMLRARDLVGSAACKALMQLINEADADVAADAPAAPAPASDTPESAGE